MPAADHPRGSVVRAAAPITRAALIARRPPGLSETFIAAHRDRLPADTLFAYGFPPRVDGAPALPRPARAYHRVRRLLGVGKHTDAEVTAGYVRVLRRHRAQVAIAEYGHTAARVREACARAGVPLVAHFHGFEASMHQVLAHWAERYRVLFREAAAVVAVSRAMRRALIGLGAPAERVYWNPCGVDVDEFAAHDPGAAPPVLVAVGRFVEKKGPDYTLRAFARARAEVPEARLVFIGEGELEARCRALASELGIADAVDFRGGRSHDEVRAAMAGARAFAQHSRVAQSGDSEGTPVAVLEAGASGLPVVATTHAGIPDVVAHGETGLLSAEGDVEHMAAHMAMVLREPALASRLGGAGRRRVGANFSMDLSVRRLWAIAERAARHEPPTGGEELLPLAGD